MRLLLPSLLSFWLLFSSPTLALSKDATGTGSIDDQFKAKVSQLKQERQASLAAIKDAKKVERATKVSENLNMINKKRTDHLLKFLDNAERILNRLANKVAKAKTSGKDTTQANAAIASARTSISTARAAVTSQAAKSYNISTTATDATVKSLAMAQRDGLRVDLQATQKVVMEAKKAVANAIKVAATTVFGQKREKGATASP